MSSNGFGVLTGAVDSTGALTGTEETVTDAAWDVGMAVAAGILAGARPIGAWLLTEEDTGAGVQTMGTGTTTCGSVSIEI